MCLISESVLMPFTQNYQNPSILDETTASFFETLRSYRRYCVNRVDASDVIRRHEVTR